MQNKRNFSLTFLSKHCQKNIILPLHGEDEDSQENLTKIQKELSQTFFKSFDIYENEDEAEIFIVFDDDSHIRLFVTKN